MIKKKKKHPRNKKKSSKKTANFKNQLFYAALVFIVVFLGFGIYQYLHQSSQRSQSSQLVKKQDQATRDLMRKMKQMLEVENKSVKAEIKAIEKNKTTEAIPAKQVSATPLDKTLPTPKIKIEKETKSLSEIQDYESNKKKDVPEKPPVITHHDEPYKGAPKLAIIIDDVAFAHEVKNIKKIPFKVSPSFFPPTKGHPNTIKLSQQFSFSMVHLPLEAMHFAHPEPHTLLASDSRETIYQRIQTIKKEFPRTTYYNNHTGSKFTSNEAAMEKLLGVMHGFGLHFVDSRTIASTKAQVVSKKLHLRLLSRDIFLDNNSDPKAIIAQLKKAVLLAKKRGYAIAIGHPHKNTLQVLEHAKGYLQGVQLVYINEI
ncbi:divergent polysaccharide deacetylase family protein [Sulfurospirillum sp. 1612]|uniref:divergent polysaccharide deacetylase family protein n=1 Tax=Sulfurospirillum sp. 1612 TaxID=3094835 RepID=UPI002F9452FB